ncbi:sensor histidine kinase [Nocardia sp. ET3-3]|uniref:Oxygen sensor histidine kinase NreB n=1 Tax=Nocardia terrae TaxID=2675851 RepID=A0A7K1VB39_9NOCA|nr:sensor histidine kinase [Nocardia terrae]MVU83787.1 sensor histidine kinase [Nocardia terrae]
MPSQDRGYAQPREDTRLLGTVVHSTFYVLLAASLLRYVLRHHDNPRLPLVIGLSVGLAGLYVVSELRASRRLVWFALLVAAWAVLVVLAPSFVWCAVPLLYTGVRILPFRLAVALVAVLTALVVDAQLKIAGWADPNVLLAPPAVAALGTALFVGLLRQTERQAALIDDLRATRQELAATERREGTLAERERLAMEIHDTLAQGLSSQRMLLQAADRVWDTDPARARAHVRDAAAVAEHNLAEARRFVHDLTPTDLAGGSLVEALRAMAERERGESLTVDIHIEGAPVELPPGVEAALLRIAQGALANAREHAGATSVTLTLTDLGDRLLLDIADDGKGFDPAAPATSADRGHGLPAMRARLRQLGGALTVESAPGDGTVVSAEVPLERP